MWRFLKVYFWVGVVLIIWLCFKTMLEDLVSRWLVEPVFSKFESSAFTTVLFVCSCLFVVWYACKCYKRKIFIGNHLTGLSVLVLVWWSCYRFVPGCMENFWSYPVNWIPDVCYVDIFALASVCCIVLKLFRRDGNIEYNGNNGFIIDAPISKEGEDILDRTRQAKDLVERLINTDVGNVAFTLGIVGYWGDGKSSFMSLMKNYIADTYGKDVIVMDFNPWLYTKGVNLTQTFFNELRCSLNLLGWNLSHQLRRYSDMLSQVGSSWSTFVSFFLMESSCKDKSGQYEELCKRMKRLGKKIVVFVDDIDRLSREEMTAVFQLVRNTSNFPNMYFVLAYDKKYVIDALQGLGGDYGKSYTEKIFQEEYVLPKITEGQIQNLLCSIWETRLDKKDYENLMGQDDIKLSNYLLNYRDVKRFFNVLLFSYDRKKGKVDQIDLILYTLLKFRYPQVSQLIMDNLDDVLIKDEYKIRYLLEDGYEKAADKALSHMDLTEYIRNTDHQKELGLEEKEIPLVIRLVFSLWRQGRRSTERSVNYQDNINVYSS